MTEEEKYYEMMEKEEIEKYYKIIEREVDEEKTNLSNSIDSEQELEDHRKVSVTFSEPVPNRYVVMMRDNIEEFAQELGVDIYIEID